jgi:hypothetical protein
VKYIEHAIGCTWHFTEIDYYFGAEGLVGVENEVIVGEIALIEAQVLAEMLAMG